MTKDDGTIMEMSATIKNEAGIHCRPSAVIVKAMLHYPGAARVRGPSGECDPRSIMGLLSLGLQHGAHITVTVEGPDETDVCHRLAALFETTYDFPPRKDGDEAAQPMAPGYDGAG